MSKLMRGIFSRLSIVALMISLLRNHNQPFGTMPVMIVRPSQKKRGGGLTHHVTMNAQPKVTNENTKL